MKRKWLSIGTILLFVGTCIIPAIAQDIEEPLSISTAPHPFIRFPAVLSMTIDNSSLELLNKPIMPETSVFIKGKIGYFAAIPDCLLHPPFQLLKHLFLFGRLVIFPQRISLTVENVPSWSDIYFLGPYVYIDISNTPHYASADLVISPHKDAPAGVHSFIITATAPQQHRIEQVVYTTPIFYMVQWISLLNISTNSTMIITPPNTMTYVPIDVTNLGNALAIINSTTPDIEGWSIESEPELLYLHVGETGRIFIMIRPPEGFQGTQQIELLFTPYNIHGTPATPIPFILTAQYP
jgi:hypothetical protein